MPRPGSDCPDARSRTRRDECAVGPVTTSATCGVAVEEAWKGNKTIWGGLAPGTYPARATYRKGTGIELAFNDLPDQPASVLVLGARTLNGAGRVAVGPEIAGNCRLKSGKSYPAAAGRLAQRVFGTLKPVNGQSTESAGAGGRSLSTRRKSTSSDLVFRHRFSGQGNAADYLAPGRVNNLPYSDFRTLLQAGKLADVTLGEIRYHGNVDPEDIPKPVSAQTTDAPEQARKSSHPFTVVRVTDPGLVQDRIGEGDFRRPASEQVAPGAPVVDSAGADLLRNLELSGKAHGRSTRTGRFHVDRKEQSQGVHGDRHQGHVRGRCRRRRSEGRAAGSHRLSQRPQASWPARRSRAQGVLLIGTPGTQKPARTRPRG